MSRIRRWSLRHRAMVVPRGARRRYALDRRPTLTTGLLLTAGAMTVGLVGLAGRLLDASPPALRVLEAAQPFRPVVAPSPDIRTSLPSGQQHADPAATLPERTKMNRLAGPVAVRPDHGQNAPLPPAGRVHGRSGPQQSPAPTTRPFEPRPPVGSGMAGSVRPGSALVSAPADRTAGVDERVGRLSDGPSAGPVVRFNGKVVRPVRTLRMRVTGYCPCAKCCGRFADGKTASGYPVWVNRGKLAAADTRLLPFGTLVSVPGYDEGRPVPVLDRGSRIVGYHLDLLFPDHAQARRWGSRVVTVTIWRRVK